MKTFLAFVFLLCAFGCDKPSPDAPPIQKPATTHPLESLVVPGSDSEPKILEAEVEGIGKALIAGRSIFIKIPVNYKESTIRIRYKVSEGVRKITPASGDYVSIRSGSLSTVCIQNDALGNCTLSYQLVIEMPSPLTIMADLANQSIELNEFLQPYSLTFTVGNLNAGMPVRRRFLIRFVNKVTNSTYTGENYMVYDLTGNPIFVNDINVAKLNIPSDGILRMTGTLPIGMSAGAYTVTISALACYGAYDRDVCSSFGYEAVEILTPLLLKAGPTLVGYTNTNTLPGKGEVLIKGRNFNAAKPLTVKLSNDFTSTLEATATVASDSTAGLALPANQPDGQYRLDITAPDGKPYSSLFMVANQFITSSFAYLAPVNSFTATRNRIPTLPAFKGGEALEMQYQFAGGSYDPRRTVQRVRMVSVDDVRRTYELTSNGYFYPYTLATDFIFWKWTLPTNPQKGDYSLVFENSDKTVSLPYFQKIRIE